MYFQENDATSGTDIRQQLQSIYNITTDESNTERLNRWSSAIRLFKDRPLTGFGPGTYQFNYGPYQLIHEKTGISTSMGDRGNAHSEFLGPLAEQGIIGMLMFIITMLYSVNLGMNLYLREKNKGFRALVLISLLSLTTYFLHSFLNNFLDTDKASILYWSLLCFLVILDIRQKEIVAVFEPNSESDRMGYLPKT